MLDRPNSWDARMFFVAESNAEFQRSKRAIGSTNFRLPKFWRYDSQFLKVKHGILFSPVVRNIMIIANRMPIMSSDFNRIFKFHFKKIFIFRVSFLPCNTGKCLVIREVSPTAKKGVK